MPHHPFLSRFFPTILVLLLAVALTLACGGKSSENGATGSDATGSPNSSQPAGSNESGGANKSDADDSLASLLRDAAPSLPDELPPGYDTTLGGTPYYAAAAKIRESLESSGIPLQGIEIHVLPISGTDASLLVFETDLTAVATDESAVPDDATPALTALLESDVVKTANVARVVLNFRAADEQGPFVLTITMPLATLGKMIDETLTDEEAEADVIFGLTRP